MNNKILKVNIASGYLALPGWINYDNSIVAKIAQFPPILKLAIKFNLLPGEYLNYLGKKIKIRDCRKKMPLINNSVDFIYTSHFLEHLQRYETFRVLKDSFRVLKSGGVIRIVVPDVKKLIKLYLTKDYSQLSLGANDERIEFRGADFLSLHFYPFENNKIKSPGILQRIQENFLKRHSWMYDFESMQNLLKKAGFINIAEKNAGESILTEVKQLDHHPEISLFIEAEKP
jgi:SAM-dependent methyltransferase